MQPSAIVRLAHYLGLPVRVPPPRRRRARRALRDFQRSRVYRWEAAQVLGQPGAAEPLSLDACRALVEAVFRWAERPGRRAGAAAAWAPPRVTDGRGRRHACGSRDAIKLPRWARTRAIVLHECAHGLAADLHGPEFVAVYLDLLARFAGLDEAALRATLGAASVAAAPASGLPRQPVRGERVAAATRPAAEEQPAGELHGVRAHLTGA
jgi:hypothetical protein